MARHRNSVLEDMIEGATGSQLGALVFGMFGLVLATPVPRMVLDAITPGQLTDNPFSGMVGNATVMAGYMLLPWMRILGMVLLALAAMSMAFKGNRPSYLTHLRSRTANNAVAVCLAVMLGVCILVSPPRLAQSRAEAVAVQARLSGRPLVAAKQVAIGDAFPASGTVQWGDEGQPIGGNLGRLEIWDVTQSPEDKVVKIRSGMVMEMPGVRAPAYAVVYVKAGQRVALNLPNNVPYKVTAIAGRNWLGPEELFGDDATTVDFGQTMMTAGRPQVIAMGAPDQTANVVGNERF